MQKRKRFTHCVYIFVRNLKTVYMYIGIFWRLIDHIGIFWRGYVTKQQVYACVFQTNNPPQSSQKISHCPIIIHFYTEPPLC